MLKIYGNSREFEDQIPLIGIALDIFLKYWSPLARDENLGLAAEGL